MEASYVPVRAKTIIPDVELLFDIYIKIQDKYILYIKGGDDIDGARLKKLQERKLKQFFIVDKDEIKYQAFLDRALANAITDQNMAPDDKADTAINVSASAVEEIYEDPDSSRAYKILEKAAYGIIEVVGKKTSILRKFCQIVANGEVDPVYRHAITTASIASCLAEHLELTEEKQNSIAIASMLLDIGRIKMSEEEQKVFQIPPQDMTDQQLEIFNKHPALGAEILSGKEHISPMVVDLVKSHEERKDGSGPLGLKTLSFELELLGLCSTFENLRTFQGKSDGEAMSFIEKKMSKIFDPELLRNLKNVLTKQGISLA